MPRPVQIDSPTKSRLLTAAQELMLTKGYAATTVEEICKAAKLTKGSFFHYFEDKEQLGREALARFCAQGAELHHAFAGQETDPLKRVYRYIDGLIRLAQDPSMKGCLLGQFSQELCDTQPAMREACCQGFDSWIKPLSREMAAAKSRYAPTAAFQPEELAAHLIAVMEGAIILGKARKDMSVIALHLRHFKQYVEGLFAAP